ncbi:uncharacterized protein si:dkey-9i23.6 isoform X2 [Pygocentrus nattereri]|uniref:uncharacterized protein si:dkey-9i23.6 isoform X2 n=1 Tax=Pygocentrus nattereri TaxID=42514 RepID=UPI00081455B6|nr:uncharacterized protein si:dkey-9i23.6 isoform X2 [Pygocentrus nattereri]
MTEGRQTIHSSSVLHSMLNRSKSNEKVKPSGLHTSKWYSHPKDTDQSTCEVTVDKLESNCPRRDHSDTTNEPQSLESAVRNGADEEITRNDRLGTDCQTSRASPSILLKHKRRKYTSNHLRNLMKEKEEDPETKGQLERESVRAEPVPEKETSRAESHFNNVKDSPTREQSLSHGPIQLLLLTPGRSVIKGKTVSNTELGPAPSKPPLSNECHLSFEKDGKPKTQEPSDKDKHMAKQGLDSCKTFENPISRPARPVSDPVPNEIRSDRSLSVPNSGSMADMNKADMHFGQANEIPEQTAMLKAAMPEPVDYDGSKTQKRVKTKNITQKLVARLKEKNGREQKRSSRSNHDDEGEARSVTSMEQAESPVKLQPSPPIPPKENSTTVHVKLQRTFTLQEFTLNLEPINLLEEVLTGEEWARFLPAKKGSPQAESNARLQTESSVPLDDVQSHSLVVKQELSAKKDESHSDVDEISISDTTLDKVSQSRQRQDKPHSAIFAVPKALITNAAVKQRRSEVPQYEPSSDDDVYDFVEVYMFPKEEPLNKSKAKELPLDVSAVKSLGVLDNSALKSRIHLSKKRMHRPPKKRIKEKPEDTQFSKFYTSCTPVDLSHHFSASTTSSSDKSAIASSVFYTNVTNWTQSCDSETSPPTPADEKIIKLPGLSLK